MAGVLFIYRAGADSGQDLQIRSFAEYDEKYSIRYLCGERIGELSRLLENGNDMQAREEVRKWADEYA